MNPEDETFIRLKYSIPNVEYTYELPIGWSKPFPEIVVESLMSRINDLSCHSTYGGRKWNAVVVPLLIEELLNYENDNAGR